MNIKKGGLDDGFYLLKATYSSLLSKLPILIFVITFAFLVISVELLSGFLGILTPVTAALFYHAIENILDNKPIGFQNIIKEKIQPNIGKLFLFSVLLFFIMAIYFYPAGMLYLAMSPKIGNAIGSLVVVLTLIGFYSLFFVFLYGSYLITSKNINHIFTKWNYSENPLVAAFAIIILNIIPFLVVGIATLFINIAMIYMFYFISTEILPLQKDMKAMVFLSSIAASFILSFAAFFISSIIVTKKSVQNTDSLKN